MITEKKLITALTFSAVILAAFLVLQHSSVNDDAWAGTASRAGDYIVATTADGEDSELLWVVNINGPQISVFESDRNGRLTPLTSASLVGVQPLRPAATTP